MTLKLEECRESSPKAVDFKGASVLRSNSVDLDALYDLAWHLCLNERKATALVLSSLHLWRDPVARNREYSGSPLSLLVQAYLRQNRSLRSRFTRSISKLKKRGRKMALSGIEMALHRLSPEERRLLGLARETGAHGVGDGSDCCTKQ